MAPSPAQSDTDSFDEWSSGSESDANPSRIFYGPTRTPERNLLQRVKHKDSREFHRRKTLWADPTPRSPIHPFLNPPPSSITTPPRSPSPLNSQSPSALVSPFSINITSRPRSNRRKHSDPVRDDESFATATVSDDSSVESGDDEGSRLKEIKPGVEEPGDLEEEDEEDGYETYEDDSEEEEDNIFRRASHLEPVEDEENRQGPEREIETELDLELEGNEDEENVRIEQVQPEQNSEERNVGDPSKQKDGVELHPVFLLGSDAQEPVPIEDFTEKESVAVELEGELLEVVEGSEEEVVDVSTVENEEIVEEDIQSNGVSEVDSTRVDAEPAKVELDAVALDSADHRNPTLNLSPIVEHSSPTPYTSPSSCDGIPSMLPIIVPSTPSPVRSSPCTPTATPPLPVFPSSLRDLPNPSSPLTNLSPTKHSSPQLTLDPPILASSSTIPTASPQPQPLPQASGLPASKILKREAGPCRLQRPVRPLVGVPSPARKLALGNPIRLGGPSPARPRTGPIPATPTLPFTTTPSRTASSRVFPKLCQTVRLPLPRLNEPSIPLAPKPSGLSLSAGSVKRSPYRSATQTPPQARSTVRPLSSLSSSTSSLKPPSASLRQPLPLSKSCRPPVLARSALLSASRSGAVPVIKPKDVKKVMSAVDPHKPSRLVAPSELTTAPTPLIPSLPVSTLNSSIGSRSPSALKSVFRSPMKTRPFLSSSMSSVRGYSSPAKSSSMGPPIRFTSPSRSAASRPVGFLKSQEVSRSNGGRSPEMARPKASGGTSSAPALLPNAPFEPLRSAEKEEQGVPSKGTARSTSPILPPPPSVALPAPPPTPSLSSSLITSETDPAPPTTSRPLRSRKSPRPTPDAPDVPPPRHRSKSSSSSTTTTRPKAPGPAPTTTAKDLLSLTEHNTTLNAVFFSAITKLVVRKEGEDRPPSPQPGEKKGWSDREPERVPKKKKKKGRALFDQGPSDGESTEDEQEEGEEGHHMLGPGDYERFVSPRKGDGRGTLLWAKEEEDERAVKRKKNESPRAGRRRCIRWKKTLYRSNGKVSMARGGVELKSCLRPYLTLDACGNVGSQLPPLTSILKRTKVTYTKVIYDNDLPTAPLAKKKSKK